MIKPESELIVQASTEDGSDGITNCSIGMCYHYVFQKNNTKMCQIGPHTETVLCSVASHTDQHRRGNSNINRVKILSSLQTNGIVNIFLNPNEYYSVLPYFKFVISPEGNGIDCHRHYESLLAGCIPVVETQHQDLISSKYGENIPVLYTEDYSEINHEYLKSVYEDFIDKTYDFSKLFLSSWDREEQQLIKKRGNYWCKRLTGQNWYSQD
jgi:hypothetical protein